MSADLRIDIKPLDTVVLLHPDGTRLIGQLTGTDRWISPGGIPFEGLDRLLKKGFVVAKVSKPVGLDVEQEIRDVLDAIEAPADPTKGRD